MSDTPQPKAGKLAILGWVFFDWACQPYFTLLMTFIYAPYFASVVVGDAARGQSLWGFATAAAGIFIACTSPVLGAVADATGRRKPWIAAFGVLIVIGASMLWFGKPNDPSSVLPVLVAFAIGSIGVEFATVFNNTMMPLLVPREKIGSLSGAGWAMGYVGGLISLVIALGFLAANPETGKTLLGIPPIFGLDSVAHEGDRVREGQELLLISLLGQVIRIKVDTVRRTGRSTEGVRVMNMAEEDLVCGVASVVEPGEDDADSLDAAGMAIARAWVAAI